MTRPYTLACPYCAQEVPLGLTRVNWEQAVDGPVVVDATFIGLHRCTQEEAE